MVDNEIRRFNRATSDQNFVALVDKWNRIAEAAIVFEPVAYGNIVRCGLTATKKAMGEQIAVIAHGFVQPSLKQMSTNWKVSGWLYAKPLKCWTIIRTGYP